MTFVSLLLAALTLNPNTQVKMPVRFSSPGTATVRTSRAGELFSVASVPNDPNLVNWRYQPPYDGEVKTGKLTFGGVSNPSFYWNDFVLAQDARNRAERTSLKTVGRDLVLTVGLDRGRLQFSLDGRLLCEVPATEDAAGLTLMPQPNKVLAWGEAIVRPCPSFPEGGANLVPVEISHRFNDGSPRDNLDVGKSWFMEGTLEGYEASNTGSFGGRWAGALADAPTRFQFRAGNRPYRAIHLIASSDGAPDSVPFVNVVFYRPLAGHPAVFRSPDVPADGRRHHLVIPLDAGEMKRFADMDVLEFELTKGVSDYALYPDPSYFSRHASGLPSSVHVYAAALETLPFDVESRPFRKAALFTEGEMPGFEVMVSNLQGRPLSAEVKLAGASYDGTYSNAVVRTVDVPANGTKTVNLEYPYGRRFGWHDTKLTVAAEGVTNAYPRPFVVLVRRPCVPRPFDDRGFLFGYWRWGAEWGGTGYHGTPPSVDEIEVLGRLGLAAPVPEIKLGNPAVVAALRKTGIRPYSKLCNAGVRRLFVGPEAAEKEIRANWEEALRLDDHGLVSNAYTCCFAEPGGIGDIQTPHEFLGLPKPERTSDQQRLFDAYLTNAVISLRVTREFSKDVRFLFPWGNPLFTIPFLRESETLRRGVDGIGFDTGLFDWLPEGQIHQISLHRLYMFRKQWAELRQDPPFILAIEGPCVMGAATRSIGGFTPRESMDNSIRSKLLLAAYGCDRQFSACSLACCFRDYGEQHYGSGLCSPLPELNPSISLAAMGTIVRHLRTSRFDREIVTPSASVYALRFRDWKTEKPMLALWTVRGRRTVGFSLPKGGRLQIYDLMDNMRQQVPGRDGFADVTVDASPVFVYGTDAEGEIRLGSPDHSDSVLAETNRKLGDFAALVETSRADDDKPYLESFPDAIRRFPIAMDLGRTNGHLSVALPSAADGRGHELMPYTTALVPAAPVVIPGRAKALAVEVEAASDWGRLVFVLRDAKGERWYGCGTQGEWNCDDPRGTSAFCFDGRRLLHVALPSNAPYDRFREAGSVCWGAAKGTGDGIVDLPLTIEKVFVERRRSVLVVNGPRPAADCPVLLGGLYAEYASAADADEREAIRLDRLTMPAPPSDGRTCDPLADYRNGRPATVRIISVVPPEHERDGRQAVISFEGLPEGASCDVWVAESKGGEGAIRLAQNVRQSPVTVRRLRPDRDFFAFAVERGKDGSYAQPSAPSAFRLRAEFAEH